MTNNPTLIQPGHDKAMLRRPVLTALALAAWAKLSSTLLAIPMLIWVPADLAGFSGAPESLSGAYIGAALLIAPLLEGILLLALIYVGARYVRNIWAVVLLVAGLLSLMHGVTIYAFTVFPGFAAFAYVQLLYLARKQSWSGFWVVTLSHFVLNLSTVAMTYFIER